MRVGSKIPQGGHKLPSPKKNSEVLAHPLPKLSLMTSLSPLYLQNSSSFTLDSTSAGLVCLSGCVIKITNSEGFVSLVVLSSLGHNC